MPDTVDPDALPFGLLRLTSEGRIVAVNAWLGSALGLPARELTGLAFERLMAPGGRVLFHTYLMPLLRLHGHLQEFALPLRDAHGDTLEMLVYASLHERAGEAAQIQVAMLPMRERRRIEGELLRVQRAADAAPGVLFELVVERGGRGRMAYASAGLLALYGLSPEQVRNDGQLLLARVHPDDLAHLTRTRSASRRENRVWTCEYRVRRDEHAPWRWHSLQATPRALPGGATAWHGFASDITAQHELALAQRERDSAERASRAKSEFLARMSHELRTPLNGIIGFARLLTLDRSRLPPAEVQRRLEIIESSGRQLLALINEVLDIARIEAGGLQMQTHALVLAPLVSQTLATLEPLAEAAQVTMTAQVDPACQVQADPSRLAQVLTNLVANAIKYNRPGGQVRLWAQPAPDHPGQVLMQVSDTGQGMSAEQLDQLFQPFNRLGAERSRVEGTGLGLVISRHLIELMGGRIEVHSELGVGTQASLWLPCPAEPTGAVSVWGALAPTESASDARLAAPAPAPLRQVLYVEDNPVNSLLMQAMLAGQPQVQLHTADTAAGALALAARLPPDLLLLDMHLPDMDGDVLLARLRDLPGLARVPAVAVSADAMPEHVAHAQAAGFDAYWTKPLDVEAVRAEVRRLLSGLDPAALS